MDKKELRELMRCRTDQYSWSEIAEMSRAVMSRIESLPQFEAALTVAVYWPLPGEVDTRDFIERWSGRKRIVLPAVEKGNMVFRIYRGPEELREGAFGISEPARGETVPAGDIDFAVVPGVAFSRYCQRLGRGKGFYDKFLADSRVFKAGVCLGDRIVDDISCQPYDVEMDVVVTPEKIFVNSNIKS